MANRKLNIKSLLRIGLYITAIGLCAFTFYVPYLYLRTTGWTAMELYFKSGNPMIVNNNIRKLAYLLAVYKIIFPIFLASISILVKKFLKMEMLAKICVLSSGIGFSFTLLFLLLTILNFRIFVYNGGVCIIIGWIFYFYASSPS